MSAIEVLGELVCSMRYASDLLEPNRVTYTVPWWGPYKAERINEPAWNDGPRFDVRFDTPQLKLDLD